MSLDGNRLVSQIPPTPDEERAMQVAAGWNPEIEQVPEAAQIREVCEECSGDAVIEVADKDFVKTIGCPACKGQGHVTAWIVDEKAAE